MASEAASGTVKSAMRTLDILEFIVRQRRPLAAHEIASALSIPVSSLAYLLSTLCERGYLERSGRSYRPGPSLARLHALSAEPTLAERVTPLVRTLRIQLNETAGFFIRRGFEIEALASEIGLHALRYTLEVGQRAPLHSFAAGKALLAAMEEAELDEYLAAVPRTEFTSHTVAEPDALKAELAGIRRSGIARTQEEHAPGIIGIGRAALAGDKVLGAFSIAIPVARLDAEVEGRAVKLLHRSTELLAASEPEHARA